ncbi:MAG: winged helix-turn-helix transcriptional regulator [Actinobacteria bacterium]|nr:MAG: winged helix-turn-helix transcriptional regulator [Actinomycetota bacterium]
MSRELSIDAADRFHSAAIHALRHVRREDPATGVPPAQLSALSVLVFGGPRTLGELAAAEQVRPPTMTRIVQALEVGGLVRRERDADDRRVHRLHATANGRRVMQRGRERRVANLATLLDRLSLDEIARVREAAELVERALAQQP